MALDGLEPDDPFRESLDEINKAANSAAALTRQLLAFSRRQIVRPRVLNLKHRHSADREDVAARHRRRRRIDHRAGQGLDEIVADPARLNRSL